MIETDSTSELTEDKTAQMGATDQIETTNGNDKEVIAVFTEVKEIKKKCHWRFSQWKTYEHIDEDKDAQAQGAAKEKTEKENIVEKSWASFATKETENEFKGQKTTDAIDVPIAENKPLADKEKRTSEQDLTNQP